MDNLIYTFNDSADDVIYMIGASLYPFTPIYIQNTIYIPQIIYENFTLNPISTNLAHTINNNILYSFNNIQVESNINYCEMIPEIYRNYIYSHFTKESNTWNLIEIYKHSQDLKIQYDIHQDSIISTISPKNCDIYFKVYDNIEDAIRHNFINICNLPDNSKSKFYAFVDNNKTLIVDLTRLLNSLDSGYLVIKKQITADRNIEYLRNVDVITNIIPDTGEIITQTFSQIIPTIDATVTLFSKSDGCYTISGTFYYPYYQKLVQVYLWSFMQVQQNYYGSIYLVDGQNPLPDSEYEYWDYLESFYFILQEKHNLIAIPTYKDHPTHVTVVEYDITRLMRHLKYYPLFDDQMVGFIDDIYTNMPKLVIDQISVIPLAIYESLPDFNLIDLNLLLLDIKIKPNERIKIAEFIRPDKYPTPVTDINKLNELSDTKLNSYHYGDDVFTFYVTIKASPNIGRIVPLPIYKYKESFRINTSPDLYQPFTIITTDVDELSYITVIEHDQITETYYSYLTSFGGEYTHCHQDILSQYSVFAAIESKLENKSKSLIKAFNQLISPTQYNTLINQFNYYSSTEDVSCESLYKINNKIMQLMYQGFSIYNTGFGSITYSAFIKPESYLHVETEPNPFKCMRYDEIIQSDQYSNVKDSSGKQAPFILKTYLSRYIAEIDYVQDWWYSDDYNDHPFNNNLIYDPDYSTFKYDGYEIIVNYDHDSIPSYDNFPKKETWNYDLKYHVKINKVDQDIVYDLGNDYGPLVKPKCDVSKYNNSEFHKVNLLNSFPVSNMHLGIVLRDNDPYIQPVVATKCPVPVVICGIPDIVYDSEFEGNISFNKLWKFGHYDHNFFWTSDLFRNSPDYFSKYTGKELDDVAQLINDIKNDETDYETMFIVHEIVAPSEFYLFIQLAKQIKNTMHPHLSYTQNLNEYKSWDDFLQYFAENYTTASVQELSQYNFVRIDSFLNFNFKIVEDKLEYDVEIRDFKKIALGTKTRTKYEDSSTNKFVYFGDETQASEWIVNNLFNHNESLDNNDLNDYNNIILNHYCEDFQIIPHTLVNSTELNLREFELDFKYSEDEIQYEIQLQSQVIKSWAAFCPSETNIVPLVNVFKNPATYKFSNKYNQATFMNAWDTVDNVHTLVDDEVFNDDDLNDYGQYKLIKIRKIYRYELSDTSEFYEYELPKGKCFTSVNVSNKLTKEIKERNVVITQDSDHKYAKIDSNKINVYVYDFIAWDDAFEYIKGIELRTIHDSSAALFIKPCKYYLLYAIAVILQVPPQNLQEFLILMYQISRNYPNIYASYKDVTPYMKPSNDKMIFISEILKQHLISKTSSNYIFELASIYQKFRLNCTDVICGDLNQMGLKTNVTNYFQQRPLLGSNTQTPTQKVLPGKVINLNEINRKFKAQNYDYLYNKPKSFFKNTPFNPLQYAVHNGLNTVLTDYTYNDFYYADWYLTIPKDHIKVDNNVVNILIPNDFYSEYTAIQTINYFEVSTENSSKLAADLLGNKITTVVGKYALGQIMAPINVVLKVPEYIYHILELPLVYWIRKFKIKDKYFIKEIHARTVPSRAIRETRFSTAKFNTFETANQYFSRRYTLLQRKLIIRQNELPLVTTDQGYVEYLKKLSYNGWGAIVSSFVDYDKFEFINKYMRDRSVDIIFEHAVITEDVILYQMLETISKYYPYTQHFYCEFDITGGGAGIDQNSMLQIIKRFDQLISQTYRNTVKISIIADNKTYAQLDPLYVRQIFKNTQIIDDIIIRVDSIDDFNEFVKSWSNEMLDGNIGILLDLSYYKGDKAELDRIANRAQFLYNFSQVVVSSKNAYTPMKG